MAISGVNPYAGQQAIDSQRAQAAATAGQQRAANGVANNLSKGSELPSANSKSSDIVTVTPENIGRLGGDVLLTPQQTKELYEKGSLQVRREFQTAESNEGFMTLTAKLAAAIVGPSRSIAAIQIDPLFLEMIKDPNAKVGMGYTQVDKETWTVMPSPEQQNLEPPILPPKPVPGYDVPNAPQLDIEKPKETPVEKPKETPIAGDIYRIARTSGQAGDNKALVAQYRADGFPPLGNGESVGDSTYDGATAEAILGRDMQVAFQYVGRANLQFNDLNSSNPTIKANARSWTETMAKKVGFEYHVGKDGKAFLTDPTGKRVPPDGKIFKDAVAKEVGIGNFGNFQKLQDHVKFVQSVGYTDPLNATALSGQVAEQTPKQVQDNLNHKFKGHSLDQTRHEYFTTNDLKSFPSASGTGTRLDDYSSATENTPVPADNLDEYRTLYNAYNSPPLSMEQVQAANPTLKDMYALHAQKFQPSLGITFANGKANVPEASKEAVLNVRIVLESNTSNGKEDELLYDSASVAIINQKVSDVFTGADMQLSVVDGEGQKTIIPQDKIVDFLGFHKESTLPGADGNSVFNDVESQITRRYNEGNNTNYQTVGNGFIPTRGTVTQPGTSAGATTIPGGTTVADTTTTVADTTTTVANTTTTTPAAGQPNYTSQSLYDAININTKTATGPGRFPPGTAKHLEGEIKTHADLLKSKIDAAGGSITVKAIPPAEGDVTLTKADVDKLVTNSVAPLEEMTLREAKDIAENPQEFETPTGGGTPRPLSGSEKASSQLGKLNDYMRAALRDSSIQPAERDAIVQQVEAISKNLFTDLKNQGIVSGLYSPDTLNQVTPEMIREKIKDPVQANSMISAVENLNYTASQVGMISDLNHATSLSRRVSDLSKRLDTFQQVEVAKKAFTGELSAVAKLEDPKIFNNFIAQAYNLQPHGTSPEVDANYETLRTAAQNGTLPFPPSIEVVDASALNGADGAYVNTDGKLESGKIMISRDILNQPERLRNVFTEEMFHHLERMSAVSDIGDKANANNRGANFEATGDEGRAAVYALRSIQNNKTSAGQIADAADTGRNQASTTRSGGNITMRTDGSDRGTYKTASGANASIEFSSPTEDVENTTQPAPAPGVGQYAAVDMDVTPRNAHPTQAVDMRGTEAELFNAAPPLQMDEATAERLNKHPKTEAAGGIPADGLLPAIDSFMERLLEGGKDPKTGKEIKGIMDYARDLQQIAEKFWKQGVANNLGNASSLMSKAQEINGYHNTQPDISLVKMSANYNIRPDYQKQNVGQINANRQNYYDERNQQMAQNNAARDKKLSGHERIVG